MVKIVVVVTTNVHVVAVVIVFAVVVKEIEDFLQFSIMANKLKMNMYINFLTKKKIGSVSFAFYSSKKSLNKQAPA